MPNSYTFYSQAKENVNVIFHIPCCLLKKISDFTFTPSPHQNNFEDFDNLFSIFRIIYNLYFGTMFCFLFGHFLLFSLQVAVVVIVAPQSDIQIQLV
ncbi:hypothetical protein CDL12_26360 [Handroanthus impetiginosus]|uniref:Uncharacterized protein n=1 Tax=Handroanthus impetiginosus TaxID=429701 RepID=A0A2G9G762_9LAMI|nr:hypothetical protein CDL12_26360 [Handroanthus impetiginosus]